MECGRFTEMYLLRKLGRKLLQEFFNRFADEMAANRVPQLEDTLSDDEYFEMLSYRFMGAEGLPDRVNEVMHAVNDLATAHGHERLMEAIREHCPELNHNGETSPEELALRLWLHAPEILTRKYNEQRLGRLTRFDYFQLKPSRFAWGQQSAGSCGHDAGLIQRLDEWCALNDRGDETVVVEKYELNGEDWYLIRHGDTFIRSTKVEKRKVETLHYRPAKDDVVVYSPARDELRINAQTRGEKELYREAFGFFLKGFGDCFEETKTYTLEPLRAAGEAALECSDIPVFKQVLLTRLELDFENGYGQGFVLKADNIFACKWGAQAPGLSIPPGAKLRRAGFQITVQGYDKPLELQVKPPNTLRLGRHGAAPKVHEWLQARGFKKKAAV